MAEGIRIGGGRKPEGKNVWRKYDGYTPAKTMTVNFSYLSTSGNNGYLKLNVTNGTVNELTASMFAGHTFITDVKSSAYYKFEFTSATSETGGTLTIYTRENTYGSWSKYSTGSWYLDKSSGKIRITNTYGSVLFPAMNTSGTWSSKSVSVAESYGNLIGFVVDDDSSAYPDGGTTSDGYYYELLGQVSSANVASLSDNTLVAVQADYREQIVSEVSQ